jgi:tetratricopeptide (TPR) repeat protein
MQNTKTFSKTLTILAFCLFFVSISFCTTTNNDELLEYVHEKYGYGEYGYDLNNLGKFHFQLGNAKKTVEIYQKLSNTGKKNSFLIDLLNTGFYNLNLRNFKVIKKMIEEIDGDYRIYYRYIALVEKFLPALSKSHILEIYNKNFKDISLSKKHDMIDEEDELLILIELFGALLKGGLEQEANNVLKKINSHRLQISDSQIVFTSYTGIIHKYNESGFHQKALSYCKKAVELISSYKNEKELNIGTLSFVLEVLLYLREPNYACQIAKEMIRLKGVNEFIQYAVEYSYIRNHCLLSCTKITSPKLVTALEALEEDGIEPLINLGYVNIAQKLCKRLVNRDKAFSIEDRFYYLFGKYYLEKNSIINTPSILNIGKQIKNPFKRGKFLVEAAITVREIQNDKDSEDFLILMNRAEQGVSGKVIDLFPQRYYDSSTVWLESDYPDKALKAIEKTEDLYERSAALFRAGEFFTLQLNRNKAMDIFNRFPYNSVFKGLLLSKIASIDVCMGNEKSALKLFKEAISIMHQNDDEKYFPIPREDFFDMYIDKLLEDYVYACLFRKVNKTFKILKHGT